MAKLIALLVVLTLGSSFAPRSAAAQTTPAAATAPAPCINGQQRVRMGRVTVGIPCAPGRQAPALASGTANTAPPRPAVAVVAPMTAPIVRPAPAPSGAWGRVFPERERAQLARFQAAPRPYSPPVEYVAAEPSPAPPPPAIMLPDTSVRRFPAWFPGVDGLAHDGITVQAGICVGPTAYKSRAENMSPQEMETWCRWWRPGMVVGRADDILIPRTSVWAQPVVTLYGRTDQGDWHYVNQRPVAERDPGAFVSAMDLLGPQVHNLWQPPMGLPAVRAVATRGHGRSHGHSRHARRVHRNRNSACR